MSEVDYRKERKPQTEIDEILDDEVQHKHLFDDLSIFLQNIDPTQEEHSETHPCGDVEHDQQIVYYDSDVFKQVHGRVIYDIISRG